MSFKLPTNLGAAPKRLAAVSTNLGALSASSLKYYVQTSTPSNAANDNYWYNPSSFRQFQYLSGSWSFVQTWQSAQISSVTVSGTTATVVLASPMVAQNLGYAVGQSLTIVSASGTTINGTYPIASITDNEHLTCTVASGTTWTSGGYLALSSAAGVYDVPPAPIDCVGGTSGPLTATFVAPASGQVLYRINVGASMQTPGNSTSGWLPVVDLGSGNYVANSQVAAAFGTTSGPNIGRVTHEMVANGTVQSGVVTSLVPGQTYRWQPSWKPGNLVTGSLTAPNCMALDNAPATFVIEAA